MAHVEVVEGKAIYKGRALVDWVPEIVDAIVAAADPVQVILFGSVARGDDEPNSDIDLMVVLPELDYAKRHEWMSTLRKAVTQDVPIQIYVTDVRECGRRRDVIGSMHYWPLREGTVVHERAA
jgi:predicted nucleotidyltransferase